MNLFKFIGWVILASLIIIVIMALCVWLIPDLEAQDYPICRDFDPTQETFGEHKLREHLSGQDYLHEFNEPDWNDVVSKIIILESSGNPNAISEDGCIGLMQISPMVLTEYNQHRTKKQKRSMYEIDKAYLYDPYLNKLIGTWYLKRIWSHYLPHYKLEQTIQNLCYAYNMGIGNLVKYRQGKIKLPTETRRYWEKYKKLANEK